MVNWWQSLASFMGRSRRTDSPSWRASSYLGYGGGTSSSGAEVTPATASALPAVYRAVSFISDALASVELRIVEELPDGGKRPVDDTDVARALSDWSFDGREMFAYHAALGGNGLAILRRNARGAVQAIESVAPCRVGAVLDEAQLVFYGVRSEFDGAGQPEFFAQRDMLHMRFRNIGNHIGNSVFAVPPIVTAAEQLGLILAARTFQSQLWKEGAYPMGVLSYEGMLKAPIIDRMRAQWEETYVKKTKIGHPLVLESGGKYETLKPGITPADSEFVENNVFGVREVSRLYGVPPSILGETGNASFSTAQEEFRAGVIYCLRPWFSRFCDTLSRALLTPAQRAKHIRIEAPLDHLLVSPGKETSEHLKELVNAGILNTNEARNVLGYADIDGGETYRVPVNTTDMKNLPHIGLGKQTPKDQA